MGEVQCSTARIGCDRDLNARRLVVELEVFFEMVLRFAFYVRYHTLRIIYLDQVGTQYVLLL